MKLEIEPTSVLIKVDGVVCRLWQGRTPKGVPVQAYISRIGVGIDDDSSELDAALNEAKEPDMELLQLLGVDTN